MSTRKNSFNRLLTATIFDIIQTASKRAQMHAERLEKTNKCITYGLDQANVNLAHVLKKVPGFKSYFSEHVAKYGEPMGDDAREALMGNAKVCLIETFGFASESAVSLAICAEKIILTKDHFSHEIRLHYKRKYDGYGLSYLDQASLFARLELYKSPKRLLSDMVTMFELRNRKLYTIN